MSASRADRRGITAVIEQAREAHAEVNRAADSRNIPDRIAALENAHRKHLALRARVAKLPPVAALAVRPLLGDLDGIISELATAIAEQRAIDASAPRAKA